MFFGQCSGECVQSYGASIVLFDDRAKQASIQFVKAVSVYFKERQSGLGGWAVDDSLSTRVYWSALVGRCPGTRITTQRFIFSH